MSFLILCLLVVVAHSDVVCFVCVYDYFGRQKLQLVCLKVLELEQLSLLCVYILSLSVALCVYQCVCVKITVDGSTWP